MGRPRTLTRLVRGDAQLARFRACYFDAAARLVTRVDSDGRGKGNVDHEHGQGPAG